MLRLLVLFVGLSLGSISAHALSAGDVVGGLVDILRPGHGGHGGSVRCSAQDQGFEEHFGGHRDCGECLRRHGRCVEVCEYTQVQCIATGMRWGRPAEFEGYGDSMREARWNAIDNCERRGGRNCQVNPRDCREQTSRETNRCGNGGGGHGGGHHGPH